MKHMLPFLGALLLSATSHILLAQQQMPHQTFIEKLKNKEHFKLGWSKSLPQNLPLKAKTTGATFYRAKAIGMQEYNEIPMAFSPADSHVIYWNTNYGENENMITNYNNTFYYKYGMWIDFDNLDRAFLQNMEYLDFVRFPRTDSTVMYYAGNYDESFQSYISNDKIDSIHLAGQPIKIYYEYDANDNITRQSIIENSFVYLLDTASYSATNKKLTHYKKEDDGTDIYEYVNTFAYDANDKLIMRQYQSYYNNVLDYEVLDSIFTATSNKDSVVSYENQGLGLSLYASREIFHNAGIIDSSYYYEISNPTPQKNLFIRNANNLITNYYAIDLDTMEIVLDYTASDLIESAYSVYYFSGNVIHNVKETYTYDASDKLIKYEDFSGYDQASSSWYHQDYDRLVNIYYELFSDEPCELVMNYKRLDPNDSLCTDIEIDFENEDLPINITVASLTTPSVVNYTITSLPFVIENMCPETYSIFANDAKNCKDTLNFTIENLTSVDQIDLSDQIRVYPNPATDVLHIEGLSPGAQLTLIDMFGRILKTMEMKAANSQLNVADLPSGLYTVQVKLNESMVHKKVIINK